MFEWNTFTLHFIKNITSYSLLRLPYFLNVTAKQFRKPSHVQLAFHCHYVMKVIFLFALKSGKTQHRWTGQHIFLSSAVSPNQQQKPGPVFHSNQPNWPAFIFRKGTRGLRVFWQWFYFYFLTKTINNLHSRRNNHYFF